LRAHGAIIPLNEASDEVLFHHFPDVSSPAVQDRSGRIQRHADRRFDGRKGRHDQLHWIDVYVQQRGPRLRQPVLDPALKFVSFGYRLAPET
jgi:hypothetical protein